MTNEFLIAGAGQPHIETIVSRLKKRYHAEVHLKAPKVPYRETHSRQSRGAGAAQEADRRPRAVRRLQDPDGADAARRQDSSLPTKSLAARFRGNFIPAVEKGIVESAARGYLAGYPVVDFKVTVLRRQLSRRGLERNVVQDGGAPGIPQVRWSRQAVLAGARHEGRDRGAGRVCRSADGRPERRRGRVQGMESKGRTTVINAEVPMAEMLTYGTLLTSMTQGKGSYRMEMHHYDIVPQLVADKILANAKRPVEEEEEGRMHEAAVVWQRVLLGRPSHCTAASLDSATDSRLLARGWMAGRTRLRWQLVVDAAEISAKLRLSRQCVAADLAETRSIDSAFRSRWLRKSPSKLHDAHIPPEGNRGRRPSAAQSQSDRQSLCR